MSQHISSTWHTDFFTELPNEFWRRAASPEMTSADIDFIECDSAINSLQWYHFGIMRLWL